jgi:2,3-bisphosphoglycerate-dependent phosphoglycerate mutase
MAKLILMRHGQSVWNGKNLFTGWVDVPLTQVGIDEALRGGRQIADIPIDLIFTSTLIRAQMTAMLAMSQHHSKKTPVILHQGEGRLEEWAQICQDKTKSETIPVVEAWQLNERYYGELQGLDKQETRERYGDEQVLLWRRSYDVPPPGGESLQMTAKRTIPFFEEKIVPALTKGLNVFVPAHGNSLRSIVMDIEHLSEEEVVKLEIPTGVPLLYEFEAGKYRKIEANLSR